MASSKQADWVLSNVKLELVTQFRMFRMGRGTRSDRKPGRQGLSVKGYFESSVLYCREIA